ncbi:MAG: LDL receptor domain-containing protein [bacterium]
MRSIASVAVLLLALMGAACAKDDGGGTPDAALPAGCVLGEFDCGDGNQCVEAEVVCDGTQDCDSGADELECGCGAGRWQCDDGQCIHAAFVCDIVENCLDASDEQGCP